MNDDYAMCAESDDDMEWLRATYRAFLAPTRKLRGLKRFEVFSSWWDEEGAIAKKSVMGGDDYDALKLGKVICEALATMGARSAATK